MSEERITSDILRTAIANDLGVDPKLVSVSGFEVSKGAKLGDGFVCDVKRVDANAVVDGKPVKLNYIAKVKPIEEERQKLMKEMTVFEAECRFYNRIAGQLQGLRKEAELEPLKLAKCFYASADEGVIVLENLKERGFHVVEKTCKGLDRGRLEIVIASLAELHATTYHLLRRRGSLEAFLLDEPLFSPCTFYELGKTQSMLEMQKRWLLSAIDTYAAVLRDRDGADRPDLADLLAAQREVCASKGIEAATPKPGDFLVLVHGDMWYNNVMFRDRRDLVLIDFQLVNVSNPGSELAYLLHSSSFPSERKAHLSRWLETYRAALAKDLVAFGYPEDTYDMPAVRRDYERAGYHGLMTGLQHCSVLLLSPDTEAGRYFKDAQSGAQLDEATLQAKLVSTAKSVPFFLERTVAAMAMAHEEGLL